MQFYYAYTLVAREGLGVASEVAGSIHVVHSNMRADQSLSW